MALPLGLSQNNPGNLRPGSSWLGMTGEANGFCVFSDMTHGYRALLKDCVNTINAGYNTITKFFNHYAPPAENNTVAYIDYVSKSMGIGPDVTLSTAEDGAKKLAYAISFHEQGVQPNQDDLNSGWNLLQGVKAAEVGGSALGLLTILGLLFYYVK